MAYKNRHVWLVLLVLSLGIAPEVFAAGASWAWAYRGPTRVIKNSSGVMATFKFVTQAANDEKYINIAARVAKGTIGALTRARVLSPWGAVLTAAMIAGDMAVDEQKQVITRVYNDSVAYPQGCWRVHDGLFWPYGPCAPSKQEACAAMAQYGSGAPYVNSEGVCVIPDPDNNRSGYAGMLHYANSCPDGTTFDGQLCVGQITQTQTVNDTDLGDWAVKQLDNYQLRDLFYDPETGEPIPIPEVQPIQDALEADWAAQNDGDPSTSPGTQRNPIDKQQQQDKEKKDDKSMFVGPTLQYDGNMDTPDKKDLVGVLDSIAAPIRDWGSNIGVQAGGGQCSFTVPVSIGGSGSSGTIDFCQFDGVLSGIGQIFLGLAYVFAAIIVLGA